MDPVELEEAKRGIETLLRSLRSIVLATVDKDGCPHSSYAPVYIDNERRLYIYVSRLARHTAYLKRSQRVGAMAIEDEGSAENLFARKRLMLECRAAVIPQSSEGWSEKMDAMEGHLGETFAYLRGLEDFNLFCLTPESARLVLGFGKAYTLTGSELGHIEYVRTGGHKSRGNAP